MVNLYEFLGIEHTASAEQIEKALGYAEYKGKDAKLILACRNLLLNEARRAQYDKSMNFTRAKTVAKSAEAASNETALDKIQAVNKEIFKKGLTGKQIAMIVGGIVVLGLVLTPAMNKFSESRKAKAELNRVADEMADVGNHGAILCGDLAKRQVKYPGTFDRTADQIRATKVVDEGSGTYSVMVPFSANNGFNVPVEHIAICKIDARGKGGVKLLSVM